MSADLSHYLPLAHRLADKAGEIICPAFRALHTIETKEDGSPVTAIDKQVESELRRLIQLSFPEHGIFGEEEESIKIDAEFVWVLDPIDGTKSFMTGKPQFGTLIALCHYGNPIIGVIEQPITGERWVGTIENSVSTLNDIPIKTRSCTPLKNAILYTTAHHLFGPKEGAAFQRVADQAKHTLYGGDCYNYALLAMGHVDIVIESGLKPYDYLALAPVVMAAGGVMTDWNGDPLTLNSDGNVLACGDSQLHAEILQYLHD